MGAGAEWTEAMIARLRELHAQEEYFSDIARILSQEFGVELTKNSCIGKGRRLGLTARARVLPPLPRKGQNRGGPRKLPAVLPGWVVEPPRLPGGKITIYQLRAGLCHYPFGDRPPYVYCGHTTRPTCPGARTTSGWSIRVELSDDRHRGAAA